MILSIFFSPAYPHRVVYASPYLEAAIPCFLKGIGIKIRHLPDAEASAVISSPLTWCIDERKASLTKDDMPTDPSEIDKLSLLSKKAKLINAIWMAFHIADKTTYYHLMGNNPFDDIIDYEIKNDIMDQTSLLNFFSERDHSSADITKKVMFINKQTYMQKKKELFISIFNLQNEIMGSNDPENVYAIGIGNIFS